MTLAKGVVFGIIILALLIGLTVDSGPLFALITGAYFIPTLVADKRRHHNVNAILVVNTFLGWTFLGWVAALAMSAGEVRRPVAA